MKFVKACMVASMAGYTTQAADCLFTSFGAGDLCVVTETLTSGLLKNQAFVK